MRIDRNIFSVNSNPPKMPSRNVGMDHSIFLDQMEMSKDRAQRIETEKQIANSPDGQYYVPQSGINVRLESFANEMLAMYTFKKF